MPLHRLWSSLRLLLSRQIVSNGLFYCCAHAQDAIQIVQVLICLCSNKAIIALHLTDKMPILLLHVALIVFECRTPARERDLFGFTIVQEQIRS